MLKKMLIGSCVAVTLGAFVFGRDLVSYAKTAGESVRQAVKREVPLEFEVQRAREMVENLVPDIRECMHVIAEQQVDVENLNEAIQSREDSLQKQEEAILALRTDLDSGENSFVYAGHSYTVNEIRRDLSHRFDRFKTAKSTLKGDRDILVARKTQLRANQDKLDNMLSEKQNLEVQIEQLEARLKTVQAAQITSTIEFDDSQLSRAKTLIRELNKQLDVKTKMMDAEGKFAGLIPVESATVPVDENIAREIDDYFGRKTDSQDESIEVKSASL
jgi:peptidoglycan hydrolase CwlO-like protein